jgi:hypothetical protein
LDEEEDFEGHLLHEPMLAKNGQAQNQNKTKHISNAHQMTMWPDKKAED